MAHTDGEKERNREEKREKRERKERKGEQRRAKEKKDVQGQLLSICIQFSKRKTEYIGRNAQNLKKLVYLSRYLIGHYN